MKKLVVVGVPVIILLLALLPGACSSSSTTGTVSSTSTTTSSLTTTVATPSGPPTAGQLSASGQDIYSSRCSRCHGNNGQGGTGPAVIGSGQALAKYNDAQGLYSFISTMMPVGSPGSLSAQEYLELAAYLLLKNGFISSGQAMDDASLSGIALTK